MIPNGSDIQIENGGWFKLHGDIVDVLARARFTATEFRAIHYLLRKTYGWKKKEDAISLSQWAEGTDSDKGQIAAALASLERKHVIYHSAGPSKWTHVWGFNKYIEQWDASIFERSKGKTRAKKNVEQTLKDDDSLSKRSKPIEQTLKDSLSKRSTTKDKKDTKTKDISVPAARSQSEQQAMFGALADVCKLDPKLKAKMLGQNASTLLKAGYCAQDVTGFREWWLSDPWRKTHRAVPGIGDVLDKLPQAKAWAAQRNGNGRDQDDINDWRDDPQMVEIRRQRGEI